MSSLPPHVFALVCLSSLISTAILVLGALVLPLTPVLWTIPGAVILTLLYHALVIFFSSNTHRNERSRRAYSIVSVGGAYTLTVVWIGALAISLTFTLLSALGKIDLSPNHPRLNPLLITATILSAFQMATLVAIGIISHKERQQERYREKWQWKQKINTSNWRSVSASAFTIECRLFFFLALSLATTATGQFILK